MKHKRELTKLTVMAFGLLLSFSLMPSVLLAQALEQDSVSGMVIPDRYYPQPTSAALPSMGQTHSYSVVFRGNGEAVVSARVVFTNTSSFSTSYVNLRVPTRLRLDEVSVYQIIREEKCVRWDTLPPSSELPVPFDATVQIQMPSTTTQTRCAQWGAVDFTNTYYQNEKYQKASYTYQGDTLRVDLPVLVAPNYSGAFFVYFRAFGYAQKNLVGAYNFTFETLKADEPVKTVTVGISSDSDQYLRGAKANVNYRFDESSIASFNSAGKGIAAPLPDARVTNFVSQIGQGSITKTASNLASLESYSVKGTYADSRWKLYSKELGIVISVALGVVIAIVILVRTTRRVGGTKSNRKSDDIQKSYASPFRINRFMFESRWGTFAVSQAVAFGSGVVAVVYTLAVVAVSQYLMDMWGYRYSSSLYPVFLILLLVLSIGIYLFLFFVPVIIMGLKKGVSWAVVQFVSNVVWLALLLTLGLVVFGLFSAATRGGFGGPDIIY